MTEGFRLVDMMFLWQRGSSEALSTIPTEQLARRKIRFFHRICNGIVIQFIPSRGNLPWQFELDLHNK